MNNLEKIVAAKRSVKHLLKIDDSTNKKILMELAQQAEQNFEIILEANLADLEKMSKSNPKYDRLKLTRDRIYSIANDLRNVANLSSPVGEILERKKLPNGLNLRKIRVPLGVIGVIYEARPNVTFDVFALCFRTGNSVVLKGGSDAYNSNRQIVSLIRKTLEKFSISTDIIQLLSADRSAASDLMGAVGNIDVLIPRGSQTLIDFVRHNSKVPVIETGAGVVHTYFDEFANLEVGEKIIFNAKTRRVSVCNALDCLVIHEKRLSELFAIVKRMAEKSVVIEADEKAFKSLQGKYPENLLVAASEESFGTEFLDYRMAVKTVSSLDEAIKHISEFSTKHSEAIISEDENSKNGTILLKRNNRKIILKNVAEKIFIGDIVEINNKIKLLMN